MLIISSPILGNCLSGLATVGAASCSTFSAPSDSPLLALCLANGGSDPCSASSVLSLNPTSQTSLISICGTRASPAVRACSTGATNLDACLNGIVSLGGDSAAATTCSAYLNLGVTDLTGALGAACLTLRGGNVSIYPPL
jgi:hypothetical protein